MLPARLRLSLRHLPDFFTRARRAHSSTLTIFVGDETPQPQLTIIVPIKHVRTHVERNLLKRRLHHIVALNAAQLPSRQLVIAAKAAARSSSTQELLADLLKACDHVRARH